MPQLAKKLQASLRPRLLAAVCSMTALAASLHGQASQLPAAEAREFLGTWTLEMDFQGNPVQMTLALTDVGGMVSATLESPRQPEPRSITDVTRTGDALELSWSQDFQGQSIALEMKLQRTEQGLTGTFGDTNGMFSAAVEAALPTATGAATVATEAGPRGGAGGGDSPGGGRRGRGGSGGTATLSLQGKDLKIAYPKLEAAASGDPRTPARDFAALEALAPGEVLSYVGGGAVKLMSGVDLVFGGPGAGERVAKAGNLAPSYPGVYSLWLKKGEAGSWSLVFNEQADIWGTQREAAADVLEVPLAYSAAPAPAGRFELALEKVGESGGLLRLTWGSHRWEAPFQVR